MSRGGPTRVDLEDEEGTFPGLFSEEMSFEDFCDLYRPETKAHFHSDDKSTETIVESCSELKNIRILAWDNAGEKSEVFYTVGKKFLEEFRSQSLFGIDEVHYLLWTSNCEEVTYEQLFEISENIKTNKQKVKPSAIVKWINSLCGQPFIELWMITDGTVPYEEVVSCKTLQMGHFYSKVKFIAIDVSDMDWQAVLSVGACFFNNCQVEIYFNEELMKSVDISKVFRYDSIRKDNFDMKWDELSDFIKYSFIVSNDGAAFAIEKLFELQHRLTTSDLERKDVAAANFIDAMSILKELKSSKLYKHLVGNQTKQINESISALINYIEGNKSHCFESIGKSPCSVPMKLEPAMREKIDLKSLQDVNPFVVVVSNAEERTAPVLLLTETDLISKYWTKGTYDKFCIMLDCPLFAKIDECKGWIIILEDYADFHRNSFGIGQQTWSWLKYYTAKNLMHGGIVFSEYADEHNDAVLFKTFFQGKRIKTCLALWYFVIWQHFKDNESIPQDARIRLKEYALRRIRNTEIPLVISTHPTAPKEIVPLYVACYFCTEGSSRLFGEEPKFFLQEKLRNFYPVANSMLDILEELEISGVDRDFVQERAEIFKILSQLNRIPRLVERRFFLLQKIFKTSPEGFLTYKVKDIEAFKYLQLLNYDLKSLIPFYPVLECRVDFREFIMVAYECDSLPEITLCKATCRPFFVVDSEKGQTSYFETLIQFLRVVELDFNGNVSSGERKPIPKLDRRWIPYDQLYIELTHQLSAFPSWEQYVEYIRVKMRFIMIDKKVYLHSPKMSTIMKYYFDLYSNLKVEINEFIEKSKKSVRIEKCVSMEGAKNDTEVINCAKSLVECVCFMCLLKR